MAKNVIYEVCPFCEQEVELENKYNPQKCPNCGEYILPCSICDKDTCINCELEKVRDRLRIANKKV
jgi:predicted RNA-binding Zn-ribbon protein involved in translation (DUF1610 family)